MRKLYLAGGCFGVEAYFSRIAGVRSGGVGLRQRSYGQPQLGGGVPGTTGHAEAVALEYDEQAVSLSELGSIFPPYRPHYFKPSGQRYRQPIPYRHLYPERARAGRSGGAVDFVAAALRPACAG